MDETSSGSVIPMMSKVPLTDSRHPEPYAFGNARDRPASQAGLQVSVKPNAARSNVWLHLSILGLALAGTASLSACSGSAGPPDTPLAHLRADLSAMRATPSATVSTGCAAALRELTSTSKTVAALQQQGKPVDAVTNDVLQSDQDEAEQACHPDAVRLCRTPANPAMTQACLRVVPAAPDPRQAAQ
jgi:hypothetical protein